MAGWAWAPDFPTFCLSEALSEGDLAEVRCGPAAAWQPGIVTKMEPLEVQLIGEFQSHVWQQVRRLEVSTVPPCEGGAGCRCAQEQICGAQALVFLDVDGVLHSVAASDGALFDSAQMLALKNILQATDAQLILSTAWRLDIAAAKRVMLELALAGLPRPISATPNLMPGLVSGRGKEILAWVTGHESWVGSKPWIAIDDLPLESSLATAHIIATDPRTGLTLQKAQDAIQKLRLLGLKQEVLLRRLRAAFLGRSAMSNALAASEPSFKQISVGR